MRVLVLGAGVNGLTAGVRLAEAGLQVDLLARELPLETTSSVAAALWYPYLAEPRERVFAWAQRSYDEFVQVAATPDSGVALRSGTELLRELLEDPWWAAAVPDLTRVKHVPTPYRDGWSFTAPVVEMPVYLRWLQRRLEEAGGTLTRMALPGLPDHADLVVNCAGLGARLLAGDDTLHPVRGQVVRVEQVGVERWLLDGSEPTYVVPRSDDIILGGTETEGGWDRRPDPQVARDIVARATALVPELAGARVLGHRVGLRPARPSVRLELEDRAGHPVIHCYGHGGAGVTTSWGCADEVLALALAV
ncbi:MAG: FAD-dependent oxidoreductase [Nocardioidaceae bacterium]|nr:FAD-dependent oxidoreductase [Nocardioidaceae bacterium]